MTIDATVFGAFSKAAIGLSSKVAQKTADKRNDWFDFRSTLLFGFDEEVGKELETGLRELYKAVEVSPNGVPPFDPEFEVAREELTHLRQKWHHESVLKSKLRRRVFKWLRIKPSLPDALDDLITALEAVSLRWRVFDAQNRMYRSTKTDRQMREAHSKKFDEDEVFFDFADRVTESHRLLVPLVGKALNTAKIVRETARTQIAKQKI